MLQFARHWFEPLLLGDLILAGSHLDPLTTLLILAISIPLLFISLFVFLSGF